MGLLWSLKNLSILNPDNLEVRRELAEIFEKGEDWNGAIREYEDLLKRTKEEDRLPIYKSLGYIYTKTGEFDKAISLLSQCGQNRPERCKSSLQSFLSL